MAQARSTRRLRPRGNPSLLSVVIPCFNEEPMVPTLRQRVEQLQATLGVPLEIVLVDDGSADGTLDLLLEWAAASPAVKVVGFSRNFGHQIAVTAGLDHATGDAVVIMDADLQDPPEVIVEMLARYRLGYDVVYGQREARAGESVFKRLSAWLFYRLMRAFVMKELPPDTGDFRLVSRPCLDALLRLRETHRFMRGLGTWVGFPQAAVRYARAGRSAGETKYPLGRMLRFAMTAVLSFSPAPLRLSFLLGVLFTLGGLGYGSWALVRWCLGLHLPGGRTATAVIVLVCLVGGALQLSLGMVGEYVARIFEEVKGRPLYLVSTRANCEPREGGHPGADARHGGGA
ncbi:MAG: glycosyltransferase family 2 protein [Deltaproteobacteria bacterium]|nr:glycosyltransferase family 2 protein [Deltaproteobacteria bacterium]